MSRRTILHSDLNSFYASVEMLLAPELRGKAVAVCGATEDRHGIVLAKSEVAKKSGVKTGMVNWEAKRLCPGLILVPPQYDQYLKFSRLVREIYMQYTDLVEPFGMDECWLDVTQSQSLYGTGTEIADQLRCRIKEEIGLTVSIGVSFTKIFAKLGSDLKKPDAVTVIPESEFRRIVWPLLVADLLYVGPATERKLGRYGIRRIGDLAAAEPAFLRSILGKNGVLLWRFANGTDQAQVMASDFVSPVKSIGHGITCNADLENPEEVWKVMLQLAQDIGHRLRVHGLAAGGVQISLRWASLSWRQAQGQLGYLTRSPLELAQKAFQLYQQLPQVGGPVRAITIRAIKLEPHGQPEQLDLYSDFRRREKQEVLDDTVDELRRRFGKGAIRAASLLGDLKMPDDGRDEVIMPGVLNW